MRRITRLAAIVGACLLAVPAVASADNLAVQVGGEVENKPWIDLQGIYPKKPVVHVGDTIDFSIVGFHTIAVQPNGSDVLPLIVPTVPAAKFPVTPDDAGNPFWWGGVGRCARLQRRHFRTDGDDVRRHGTRPLGPPPGPAPSFP